VPQYTDPHEPFRNMIPHLQHHLKVSSGEGNLGQQSFSLEEINARMDLQRQFEKFVYDKGMSITILTQNMQWILNMQEDLV